MHCCTNLCTAGPTGPANASNALLPSRQTANPVTPAEVTTPNTVVRCTLQCGTPDNVQSIAAAGVHQDHNTTSTRTVEPRSRRAVQTYQPLCRGSQHGVSRTPGCMSGNPKPCQTGRMPFQRCSWSWATVVLQHAWPQLLASTDKSKCPGLKCPGLMWSDVGPLLMSCGAGPCCITNTSPARSRQHSWRQIAAAAE
jgi:hypothetical protein